LGSLLYFAALLLAAVLLGYGQNPMTPSFRAALDNIWIYATVLLISEIIRVGLIKGSPEDRRPITAAILTVAYTFLQLDSLKSALGSGFAAGIGAYFFFSVFPTLALNAVLSYVALEGPLRAVLLLRCTYSLSSVLLPFLPNAPRNAWAIVSSFILFVSGITYHLNMRDRGSQLDLLNKKRLKYQPRGFGDYGIPAIALSLLAAFMLRAFSYFPVVVLTGSMTGAIDQGSIVLVEKVGQEKALQAVQEGDVIHFRDNRNIEIMHRVIGFGYDNLGERVYITQGDANPNADISPVQQRQVLGIARAKMAYLGYPLVFIRAVLGS
jgi:signal peptidase